MKRQALTDGSGHWIDLHEAESFDEATWWNGKSRISKATGSQSQHQQLYHVAPGRWVIQSWSRFQGVSDTWEEVDHDAAAKWLSQNGHGHSALTRIVEGLDV